MEASGVPEDQEAVLGRMGGESSSARNRTDFVGCCQEGVWEGREREGAQGRYSYYRDNLSQDFHFRENPKYELGIDVLYPNQRGH